MTKYVLKRIGLALVTCFIILSITFILVKCLGTDKPVGQESQVIAFYNKQVSLGYFFDSATVLSYQPEYSYTDASTGVVHNFYSQPIMQQYVSWLTNVVTKWDWGVSTKYMVNVDVNQIILSKLPATVEVNAISVVISVPLGIALGIWAALKKNKMTDHVISTLVMIFISVPSFVTITFLVLIFGYWLKCLPTKWFQPSDPLDIKAASFVIPVMAMSFGSICGYCRFTRAELCEVMSSDYLLLARTKGLTKSQTVVRHALRNAMVPILPSILAEIVGVLSGSIILETLYNIPGIGALFYTAINSKDYNLLMADMAVFTTIGLLAGIVLDISYGFLDPRIRMGEKK